MKMNRFLYSCLCWVLALVFSGQAVAADSVALVSDVSGSVGVSSGGGSSPVKMLASIPVGAKVELRAGSKLSLIYVAKGDEYTMSGPGSYQLDVSSPQTIAGAAPVKQASLGGALNGKRIRSENVSQATITMRGFKKSLSSLDPLTPSGSVTFVDPLSLQWASPMAGLTYKVQIKDGQDKILLSKEVKENSVVLTQDIPLASGGSFIWSISTTLPDGSAVSSSAPLNVAADDIRVQSIKIKPGKNATVPERVVYGLWLEGEKLDFEARQVWGGLAADFPDELNFRDRAIPKP